MLCIYTMGSKLLAEWRQGTAVGALVDPLAKHGVQKNYKNEKNSEEHTPSVTDSHTYTVTHMTNT